MPVLTVHPKGWAQPKGYANGTLAEGRVLFIGGQIGWTADQAFVSTDFIGQTTQALQNVASVVEAAGGHVTDIARMTWYITDKRAYVTQQKELGQAYRGVMGHHYPAMTMVVVAGLIEDKALVEIEATAVLPVL